VLASDSHMDFFIRNMVAILAEFRAALRRPREFRPTRSHAFCDGRPGRHYAVRVPSVAAASDSTVNIGDVKRDGTVTKVAYIPDSAITGANTETRTISVLNKGQAGTGTTSVASLALTSGVNAAVSDEKALPSRHRRQQEVAEGDVLAFKSLHSGSTGLADPGGLIVVEVQPEFD
jgi:hypothetical protein